MVAMESGGVSRTSTPLNKAGAAVDDIPFAQRKTKICVYCGSSPGTRPEHMEAARQLAQTMAANNIGLGEAPILSPPPKPFYQSNTTSFRVCRPRALTP